MSMPSLVKSWQHSVNIRYAASGTVAVDHRRALYTMVSSMLSFSTNPWTHLQSCDSSGVSSDPGTNLWTDATKLIWNTSAGGGQVRSWIVIKQTKILSNLQVLIECHAGTGATSPWERFIRVYISASAGFGSGTTTSRPTATDEVCLCDGSNSGTFSGYWFYANTSTFAPVIHVMQSSDGECTRVVFCCAGKSRSLFVFDKQCNPVTGATAPFIAAKAAGSTDATYITYAYFNDVTPAIGLNSSLAYSAYFTSEGYVAGMLGERLNVVANEISGEWPLSPIGLASETTGARGRHGTLYDIWWGTSNQADGTTYPASGAKTLVQFGHIVLPWNGTSPLLT
jgi:hypothetical protein